MAKSDSERGPFGAWLVQQRKARPGAGRDGRMTAAEVRAWLIRDRGFGIGESAYAELESGTALPSAEQRRHLAALFDSEPPGSGGVPGNDALAAAITRQAAAIEAQAAEQAVTNRLLAEMMVRLEKAQAAEPAWVETRMKTLLGAVRLAPMLEGSGAPQHTAPPRPGQE